eukprot:scaffold7.g3575.t1
MASEEEEPSPPPPARAWLDALPVLLVVAATVPLDEALALQPLCRELCAAVDSRVRGFHATTEDAAGRVCGLRAERWPQLQKLLLLGGPGGGAAQELGAVLGRLPRLRELTLEEWLEDRACALFAVARLPALERLRLVACCMGVAGLEALAAAAPGLPSLRHLELLELIEPDRTPDPAEGAADALQGAAAGDAAAGDAAAEHPAAGGPGGGGMAGEPAAGAAGGEEPVEPHWGAALAPAFQHWPALESFTVAGCHAVGCTPSLLGGLRWCRGLRSLDLSRAWPYSGGSVMAIPPFAEAWPQLTSLNLHSLAAPDMSALGAGPPQATVALEALVAAPVCWPQLRRLDIGCLWLSAEALRALAAAARHWPLLEALNMDYCRMWEGGAAALAAAVRCFPALQELHASRCRFFHEDLEPLLAALARCRRLRRLVLTSGARHSTAALPAAAALAWLPPPLEDLRCGWLLFAVQPHAPGPLPASSPAPLAGLRDVSLRFDHLSGRAADEFAAAGACWPQLRSLRLKIDAIYGDAAGALGRAAFSWRELEEFSLRGRWREDRPELADMLPAMLGAMSAWTDVESVELSICARLRPEAAIAAQPSLKVGAVFLAAALQWRKLAHLRCPALFAGGVLLVQAAAAGCWPLLQSLHAPHCGLSAGEARALARAAPRSWPLLTRLSIAGCRIGCDGDGGAGDGALAVASRARPQPLQHPQRRRGGAGPVCGAEMDGEAGEQPDGEAGEQPGKEPGEEPQPL